MPSSAWSCRWLAVAASSEGEMQVLSRRWAHCSMSSRKSAASRSGITWDEQGRGHNMIPAMTPLIPAL